MGERDSDLRKNAQVNAVGRFNQTATSERGEHADDLHQIARLLNQIASRLAVGHAKTDAARTAENLITLYDALHQTMGDTRLFDAPSLLTLLQLFLARQQQKKLSIAQVTRACHAAPTTILRHLDSLERLDLISRAKCSVDSRIVELELTVAGAQRMKTILETISW